jgi:hypothetical protein
MRMYDEISKIEDVLKVFPAIVSDVVKNEARI